MPSFKLKRRVLCSRMYTSPSVALFGISFSRIFAFIFLVFKPYHMVNSSTIQYLL